MKILCDENIDLALVQWLRGDGQDCLWVRELSPSITDSQVLELAELDNRIVITFDLDFGELVFRERRNVAGILLLRFPEAKSATVVSHFAPIWIEVKDLLAGHFVVATPRKIRVRELLI